MNESKIHAFQHFTRDSSIARYISLICGLLTLSVHFMKDERPFQVPSKCTLYLAPLIQKWTQCPIDMAVLILFVDRRHIAV